MRPLLVPAATRPALLYLPVPARRRRRDSAEFSLGGEAYVVVPGLHAPPRGLGFRIAEWSRRVRRLLGEASFRAVAALAVTGFAWLCEQGGA